jgi:hypothetical protein
MTISLNKNACNSNGITLDEAFLLLIVNNKINLKEAEESLIQKGFITADRDSLFHTIGWRVTNKGQEIIGNVIVDSDKLQKPNDKLTSLATELKELFPKGKKPGTNYYWADGVALIVRRLKLFFKKYGNTYTDNQIITATKKYVESFNGNYQYMRLLKYFILKEKIGVSGEVEGDSELISYIENAGQEDSLGNDWTSELR